MIETTPRGLRSYYTGSVLFLLLVCSSACAAPTGSEGEEPLAGERSVQGSMHGVQLTPEQVTSLQEAQAQREHMTIEDVAEVTGISLEALQPKPAGIEGPEGGSRDVGGSALALEHGYDDSNGNCSLIVLNGWDNGDYHFEQYVYGASAVGGEIVISTDGAFVLPDIWIPSGPSQSYADGLHWTGVGANATTMTGWMLTSSGSLCTGELYAEWF